MPASKTRSPGQILTEDFLPRLPEDLRDQGAVARRLEISRRRWNEILNGRRAITPDTALRLGRFFGTGPEFWLDAQARWELQEELASRRKRLEIEAIVPALTVPVEHGRAGTWNAAHELERLSDEGLTLHLAAGAHVGSTLPVGSSVDRERYYREFLERKGMLREGQRYVDVRSQLEAVQRPPQGRPQLRFDDVLPLFVGSI